MLNKKNTIALIIGTSLLTTGVTAQASGSGENTGISGVHHNQNLNHSLGDKLLSQTNWQGTRVYDKNGKDLSKENQEFLGLAKYDATTNYYEFFDPKTGKSRGDSGRFFVTNDGQKRVLISESKNYQAVVNLTELNNQIFTYTREGKDENGNKTKVYVEHIPTDKKLTFSKQLDKLKDYTGYVNEYIDGTRLLSNNLWRGSKVLDENGKNVTKYNQEFISIAKFDSKNNKYEFFNPKSKKSKNDFGYYDVNNQNKMRMHVSISENKYGAALELTELNENKFTYTREGKDKNGKKIKVYVEHKPYFDNVDLPFSF